jgi:uncharacterized protein YbcV (DUF1398 family)
MEPASRQAIEQCARYSHAGIVSFPEVIATLARAGVESYHADYRREDTTYYTAGGTWCSVPLPGEGVPVAAAFDVLALQAAIRGAQGGVVKYPEFLRLSRAAGCVGYIVWIAGRHLSYFGRLGEVHIERFPD